MNIQHFPLVVVVVVDQRCQKIFMVVFSREEWEKTKEICKTKQPKLWPNK